MSDPEEQIHISTEDARGGQTGTGMRYVLMVSLFLVVVVLSVIWLIPAMTQTS